MSKLLLIKSLKKAYSELTRGVEKHGIPGKLEQIKYFTNSVFEPHLVGKSESQWLKYVYEVC